MLARALALLALASALGSAEAAARPTLVVAPFTSSSSEEYQWIGHALAEALTERVLASGEANAFSQKQWAAVLRERDISYPPVRDVDDARHVARQLGADTFVVGTFHASWPFIDVTARHFAIDGTEPIATARVELPLEALLDVEKSLATTLLKAPFPKAAARPGPAKDLLAWRSLALCRDAFAHQSLGPRAQLWLPAALAAKARGECETAQKRDKNLHDATAFIALARAVAGERADAIKTAEAAVKARTVPGWPDLVAAFLHRLDGKPQRALEILEAAAKKAPGHLHLRTTLGETYAELKRYDDAERTFRAALDENPRQPWVLSQLGKVQSLKGDVEQGLATTTQALALVEGDPILLLEKASREIDAKRYPDAETTLRAALEADPRVAALYLRLGYVYVETNQLDLARPVLKKALYEADRESERRVKLYAHYDLAKVAARQGDKATALAELGKAVAAGFVDRERLERDPDLVEVVKDPAFAALFSAGP